MLVGLTACEMVAPETLVDELRVVAATVEPLEAAPGEQVSLRAWVADPLETGFEVWAWDGLGLSEVVRLEGTEGSWTVPAEAAALTLEGSVEVPLWVLACEPGLCTAPTTEQRADPNTLLEDLPLTGVSLALRTLWLGTEGRTNPTLTPADTPLEVAPGDQLDLAFETDAETAFGLATAGGFVERETDAVDGAFEAMFLAPEVEEVATAWVVVQGADGGTAVWTGSIEVR